MQNTSSGNTLDLHMKNESLPKLLDRLAGLKPALFDEEVKPLREHLESLDKDKTFSKTMLVDNVVHHKAGDTYVRELHIPKNSIILSRVHKRPLVNILSKGCAIVVDTTGRHEYHAPCTWVSPAGTQRLVFCPETTVWNTAHVTKAIDTEDIVEDLTADNYQEYISVNYQITQEEL